MNIAELANLGNVTLSISAQELLQFCEQLRKAEREDAISLYKMTHENKTYTIKEVADILKVTTKTIRRWIDQGMVIPSHPGNGYRFTMEDIQTLQKIH